MLWRRSFLKTIFEQRDVSQEVKYFNTMRCVREYANPIYDIKHSTKKMAPRSREEWIGISSGHHPARPLRARAKTASGQSSSLPKPRQAQLLSGLVRCGSCGGSVYATRRWVRSKRKGPPCVIHELAYKCNWSFRERLHSKQSQIKRCHNPQIQGSLVEGRVFAIVRDVSVKRRNFRMHVDFYKEDARKAEARIEKGAQIDRRRASHSSSSKSAGSSMSMASGDLSRDAYVRKNRELMPLSRA